MEVNKLKYKSIVTALGEMVSDFLEENFVIIFNDNAPSAMAEVSVLHTIEQINGFIEIGDQVKIGGDLFQVTAVGEEANKTFYELGHCTIKFTGNDQVQLPGEIELKGNGTPKIEIGDVIEIF
jgi:PTS system glucitol/sorbitol-specific IIA component